MHQGLPVIATDAVGAAAGGLVRHERNGLVVAAGDAGALGDALLRLRDDAALRARLGAAAARDVAAYTFDAWAAGVSKALAAASLPPEGDRLVTRRLLPALLALIALARPSAAQASGADVIRDCSDDGSSRSATRRTSTARR